MSENAERLVSIQKRVEETGPISEEVVPSYSEEYAAFQDRAFLLELVRKQQAAMDAVRLPFDGYPDTPLRRLVIGALDSVDPTR